MFLSRVSLTISFSLMDFQLWDATVGQEVSQFNEHVKRAWSVDFSPVHPTKLASGSDDCAVKLWSINEACPFSVFHFPSHSLLNLLDYFSFPVLLLYFFIGNVRPKPRIWEGR